MLLQSRAIDETGYVQPTKTELRKVRGVNSIYHNNGIQTWLVKARWRGRECRSVLTRRSSSSRSPARRIAAERKLDIGRVATPAEIAGWDIDVRPDGQGLPPGSGAVKAGEAVYMGKCAACHGEFGESAGRWPQVAGGAGSLKSDDPVKTVGSYFAHLSTVFDYVRHAMPFGDAQSLTNDELYAVVAYMLFLNDIVDEKFVLSTRDLRQREDAERRRLLRRRPRDQRKGVLESEALHGELQARGEDHRPRARDRRDAGRQGRAQERRLSA